VKLSCITILNEQKYLFFKNGDRKVKQVLSRGLVPVGMEEGIRKGCRRMNMVKILCPMYENGKMRPA
jgi:hypothetical protein